jgi:hypothetical protein
MRAARATALVVLAGLAALAAAVPAQGASDQEALLQDDPRIVFEDSAADLDRTLAHVKSLGFDRIRVSVFWNLFGPDARSPDRPDFEHPPTDPRAYSPDAWRRYDRVVRLARKHDLGVLLNVTGPAPNWAAAPKGAGFNKNRVVYPRVSPFGDWMHAVGRRYSGTYPDPEVRGAQLPRVGHWSIWNEPNFPSWLYPQWRRIRGRLVAAAPIRYRLLVEAAYDALRDTGHGEDTVLLGETAPGGERSLKRGVLPLIFLRELYCLNRAYRPYGGRAAKERGCPASAGARAAFVRDHPGLFQVDGFAHHPYNRYFRPTYRHPDRDAVTMGDIPRLTRALDRVMLRWGAPRGIPVWLTEHGYQTEPPDPTARVSPFRAGLYIAEADFMAYRNPRVASTAQFLLFDDAPRRRFPRRKRRLYWGTWQSGLFTEFGRPKPTLDFFRFPIAVTGRAGRSVRVWGQYRPNGVEGLEGRVELQRFGEKDWQELHTASVSRRPSHLDARVTLPGSGRVRIVWTEAATGVQHATPPVQVRVR